MNLGVIALAVTLGSIIGMAAILWDLEASNRHLRGEARFYERRATDYMQQLAWARQKLARFDRVRGDKGKYVKKGGA